MHMNETVVEGILAKTPTLKKTTTGKILTQFSLENIFYFEDRKGERQESNWITCEAFGELAEKLTSEVKEKDAIQVYGRLRQQPYRTWTRLVLSLEGFKKIRQR
jgi:single-stranded DNA-binding protein